MRKQPTKKERRPDKFVQRRVLVSMHELLQKQKNIYSLEQLH